ncbi:MAG: DUF3696 domain-containing protein [Planctomycetes bacterium]|nr:DUF3696 domain-containing protein [Planctomycetota bacterium]
MAAKPNSDSKAESRRRGITAVSVTSFKSIYDKCRLEIRPLTILCGANSSGKSSAMQPLLLLKQTLEATYDPGPLLLNGPNVRFTKVEQMVPRARGRDPVAGFQIAIEAWGIHALSLAFRTRPREALRLEWMAYASGGKTAKLRPGMSHRQAVSAARKAWGEVFARDDGMGEGKRKWSVARSRCFLEIQVATPAAPTLVGMPPSAIKFHPPFEEYLRSIVHVPALRGNPERTYKTTAVGPTFPGIFQEYPASIVFHWQTTADHRLAELGEHLAKLGLTWMVHAQPVDETQLELRVGRLPRRSRGGRNDLVSIADVGFGVSQALPVVVALLTAGPGQLVYIEQPEIHLHPLAQTELAELLAAAALRGVRVVAETHSSLLLLAVQTLVAEGKLSPDLVKLHWFQRDKEGVTKVTSADLDTAGAFGDWPEDFGDVDLKVESRYLDAAEQVRMK